MTDEFDEEETGVSGDVTDGSESADSGAGLGLLAADHPGVEEDQIEADLVDPEFGDDAYVEPEADTDGDAEVVAAETDTDDEPAPAPRARPISPYDRPGAWYVVHTQSGYENKVRQNIEARIASMGVEDKIFEVTIPMEDVTEIKGGKKVVVQKKMFPGYLLVRCWLDDDSWFVIRNTPGVTGFVGQGAKPSPLPRRDVENFLAVQEPGDEAAAPQRARPTRVFEINETVRVKEGPFADFTGTVIEINEDKLEVRVLVNIFGRETPVTLGFGQVAKL